MLDCGWKLQAPSGTCIFLHVDTACARTFQTQRHQKNFSIYLAEVNTDVNKSHQRSNLANIHISSEMCHCLRNYYRLFKKSQKPATYQHVWSLRYRRSVVPLPRSGDRALNLDCSSHSYFFVLSAFSRSCISGLTWILFCDFNLFMSWYSISSSAFLVRLENLCVGTYLFPNSVDPPDLQSMSHLKS